MHSPAGCKRAPPCIMRGGQKRACVQEGGKTRKYTVAECERDLGIPSGFVTKVPGVTPTQQQELCGNGWHIPTVKEILLLLPPLLGDQKQGAARAAK